jgi:alpha-galactosidase
MVEKGLDRHGWTYINIDDGWQGARGGAYNAIQPNTKFPDMKALVDEIHAMGLKVGIYSSPWIGTYAAHIGSYSDNPDGVNQWIKDGMHNDHFRYQKPGGNYWRDRAEMYKHGAYSFVEADVRQWAEWGMDYLKYDWNPNDRYHTAEMHDALLGCDRDIVYSISNKAPYADAPLWMELCNCWRTTSDIRDNWESVSSIGFAHDRWMPFTGPGHWADPDMLVVGMV